MKTLHWNLVALALAATLSATIAQSKYSGIYGLITSDKEKVVFAMTKGGNLFGMGNGTHGLKEAIDPTRSSIDSEGKFKAVVPDGTTLTGTVDSEFQLKGTIKSDEGTSRISGKRTLH